MIFDQDSLLLALGFSGICLAVTLFGNWLMARRESFLITWALGVLLLVGSSFTYGAYGSHQTLSVWIIFYLLLVGGLSTLTGAAYQFRTGERPLAWIGIAFTASCALGIPVALAGYSGLATIIVNLVSAILLFAAAWQHWKGRAEAPGAIAGLAALYSAIAITFILCAWMIAQSGQMIIDKRPSNWAEDLNLLASIAGMTGIGALSLALNQFRTARNHRRDAVTDALTGLKNRRALFSQHAATPFQPSMAVILFDLDRFKEINDRYGHAAGDSVLTAFAEELRRNTRATDLSIRLGGEEFALILERTHPDWAHQTAERIRHAFASRTVIVDGHGICCTASAGIAFGSEQGHSLDAMLSAADRALYAAKNDGRNRIAVSELPKAG